MIVAFAAGKPRRVSRDETEVREVVSDDPSLSPEANRVLTRELREAVGAERVRVPRDAPHVSREHRAADGARRPDGGRQARRGGRPGS